MIACLSLIACVLCMVSSYFVAHARLRAVYCIGLANCGCLLALNVLLSASDPGVLLMVIPSVWGIAMNVVGLQRLRRQAEARNGEGIIEEPHSKPEDGHEAHTRRIR